MGLGTLVYRLGYFLHAMLGRGPGRPWLQKSVGEPGLELNAQVPRDQALSPRLVCVVSVECWELGKRRAMH